MESLSRKVQFLSDPASYAGATAHVEARETHMSWVFLTDTRVFKLKKPVSYPFLDFSTLERRRFFCQEELRLNRRLAGETYRAVLPLRRDRAGELTFSGDGQVVDWLVEMERLAEQDMLDARIVHGRITKREVEKVGEKLAGFYACCQPEIAEGSNYLHHLTQEQAINRSVLEQPKLGLAHLARKSLDAVDQALIWLTPEIDARISRGRLVEGHGDLRPEHICLADPPLIIDCLEFNRAMRIIDPFDEVNYLGLECEMLKAPWIRPLLLRILEERLSDRPSVELLALYGGFRALLRARICLAHLLETPVRHPEKWRPLAIGYIQVAEKECLSLPSPADPRSIRTQLGA